MIIYQLLPRLLGKGKFSELDSVFFDYLKSLSVTHLWLTGIPRHATGEPFVKGDPGCPYSVCDYYDTNPYLADEPENRLAEFKAAVARAHENGLKVIMDFIPNHVAVNYSDSHGGIPVFDHCDYDWTDTRKINYGAEGTWQKMLDIILFWASMGVDGFRCDMVELVSTDFFGWMIKKAKAQYNDLIFIGEAYEKGNYRRYIEEAGFDYLYDKSGMYDILRKLCTGNGTARELTWNWQALSDLQPRMLNFLENHDEQRLASSAFAGSASKGMAALAVSALFNSTPFMLFFGQEAGEAARESGNCRTSIFDWAKPATVGRLAEGLYAVRRGEKSDAGRMLLPAERETLARYRSVLKLATEAADASNYDLCYCSEGLAGFDPDRHFAFLRSSKKGTWLVVCNFSRQDAEIPVYIPAMAVSYRGLAGGCSPTEGRIMVKLPVKSRDFALVRLY